MKDFVYARPRDLAEALETLEFYGGRGRPFLGGTDLLVRLQKGHIEPEAVIDLKKVDGLSADTVVSKDSMIVGARMILADLIRSGGILENFPALIEGASTVGSVQIRNRATLTGNICNASPAADTVPSLLVYGASVRIIGRDGERMVPLKDFFLGPGKTLCGEKDLVVAVHIPLPSRPFGAAFERLTRRKGVDLATINMACGIDSTGVTTFVFGAAGPVPVVALDETGELAAAGISREREDEILKSLIKKTNPISDVRAGKDYREAMLLALGGRVLHTARQRLTGKAG